MLPVPHEDESLRVKAEAHVLHKRRQYSYIKVGTPSVAMKSSEVRRSQWQKTEPW